MSMAATLQDSLFDPPEPIKHVGQPSFGYHHRNAGKAEMRAARAQVEVSGARQKQVLKAVAAAGFTGLTRQEIADREGVLLQTVCSTVRRLVKGELLIETTRERAKRGVIICTPRGFEQAAKR